MRPYRCTNCAHRFLVAAPALVKPRRRGFAGVAGLFAAVLFGVALVLMVDGREVALDIDPPVDRPALLTTEILEAAQEGNADAQFRVGKNLLYGALSDNRKAPEALQWLQQAAENGSTAAMVHLGRLYRTGVGALQNYKLSGEWLERAARGGDAEGMLELGRLYRDGVGFEQDPMRAYVWFNRSAAALNVEAAFERDALARRLTPEQLKAAQDQSIAALPQSESASADQAGQ